MRLNQYEKMLEVENVKNNFVEYPWYKWPFKFEDLEFDKQQDLTTNSKHIQNRNNTIISKQKKRERKLRRKKRKANKWINKREIENKKKKIERVKERENKTEIIEKYKKGDRERNK